MLDLEVFVGGIIETIRLIYLQHANTREVLRWLVACGTEPPLLSEPLRPYVAFSFAFVGFPLRFLARFRTVMLFATTSTAFQ